MIHFPSPGARLILREKSKVLPSIWQQPDYRGEEHKEADTGEGQSYPGEDGKRTTLTQQLEPGLL